MTVKRYYEAYWSPGGMASGVHQGTYPELLQLLSAHVTPTSRCLDVGCGDGQTSGLWLREHAGSYIGVDIAPNIVEQARALGLDARVIEDAATLPFADHMFDVVICTEVLEHLFNPLQAAGEIRRVLQPGGVLIATVPNVAYWRWRLDLLINQWGPSNDERAAQQPWEDPHIRFFNISSLQRMLEIAGFRPVRVGGHFGLFLGHLPGLRYARRYLLRTRLGGAPQMRRIVQRRASSRLYQRLERSWPSLFALRLHAVATKPLGD